MPVLTILGIAVGLALDAFAVAVATGSILPRITFRHYFRLGFHFGLFQAMMPALGWLAGRTVEAYVESWDHWIAFGLLSYVGGRMLLVPFESGMREADPTRGLTLVVLSIATSIDALAAGFTLALLRVEIVGPALIIGLVTGALTVAGMKIGDRIGIALGSWARRIGGALLIGIGIRILASHLLA